MVCKDRVGGKKAEYDAAIDPQSGRPGDSLTTREVIFEWGGDPFKEPVWVDLMTGWIYEIPAENQIVTNGESASSAAAAAFARIRPGQ